MLAGSADAVVASAMRPGAVLGLVDDARVNFVRSYEDIARGEVAGYNSLVRGNYRQLFPRMSQRDYMDYQVTLLPEIPGALDNMLSLLPGLSNSVKNYFKQNRKVVARPLEDGKSQFTIVQKVPEALDEVEIVELEEEDENGVPLVVPGSDELRGRLRSKTYRLMQVFTDVDVVAKYQLPVRVIETTKRLAATDAGAAAKALQDYMNAAQSEVKVTIKADDVLNNRQYARNTLRAVGRSYARTDASILAEVIGDQLLMYGPDGVNDWHVKGPLLYAQEVEIVYWMVLHEGCIFPSVLFAMEQVLLRIDICDGVSYAEPVVTYHAGSVTSSPRLGLSNDATSLMTAQQRTIVAGLTDRLIPVESEMYGQLGTAVQVTGRHALVNSHVIDVDPMCQLDGQPVVVSRQLSRDLWSAKSVKECSPWVLREPVKGEQVIICYMVDGEVSCTSPIQIVSIADSTLVLSMIPEVGPGVSGGAVVALQDMALLGLHSGATRTNLLAYRFGETQFAEIIESDSITAVSRQEDVGMFAVKVIDYFTKKGLKSVFATSVASMVPVYCDNAHVGMAVHSDGYLYTTCDPTSSLRFGVDKKPMVLESNNADRVYRSADTSVSATPMFRRTPTHYEKVFVVGNDGFDPYISAQTEVSHIGLNARNFVIRDLPQGGEPLTGGIVMGWDGAFLGICGQRSMTTATGIGFTCWPIKLEKRSAGVDPKATLAAAFPFLSIAAWPDEVIEEIFTHTSVGKYSDNRLFNAGNKPLANVGDNLAKAALYTRLRELGVPHSKWAHIMQFTQSNASMAEMAWKFGYARCMRLGPGADIPKASKAYADLTEAVVGAAGLIETSEVVDSLCKALGLVEIVGQPNPPQEYMVSAID